MPGFLLRFILAADATFWMVVVYGIKEKWRFWVFSNWITGIMLLLIPIVLSLLSILFVCCLEEEGIQECRECALADNEFLPVYLGYFFVALSISDCTTLCFIYLIVFVFTFLTQTQYFNPIFLLFGYHFYHITTGWGTRVFVIARGEVKRHNDDIKFTNLRRINNTTYITKG